MILESRTNSAEKSGPFVGHFSFGYNEPRSTWIKQFHRQLHASSVAVFLFAIIVWRTREYSVHEENDKIALAKRSQ